MATVNVEQLTHNLRQMVAAIEAELANPSAATLRTFKMIDRELANLDMEDHPSYAHVRRQARERATWNTRKQTLDWLRETVAMLPL